MRDLFRPFAFAAGLSLLLAFPAWAQLAGPASDQRSTRDMLADQLVLLLQDALAGQGMPGEDQYIRAGVLLSLATELSPENPELWRTKAELAQVRGRSDERRQALTRYLRLAPSDDAAQLELILSRVAQAQTLDDRLAMLVRLLDAESSKALSQPLRSRLASMAATAAKEIGDRGTYVQRLKQSIGLDAANGDAARMLYQLALEESDSPLHHGAAALAWVRGEPSNPEGRLALARILFGEGVYDEAAKQYSMAAALLPAPPEAELMRLWASSLAMAGQTDEALLLLRQMGGTTAPGIAPSAEAPPLPVELEIVRLAILSSAQRRDEAQQTWRRLNERMTPLVQAGDVSAQRELAVASAVFGQELEQIEARLQADATEPVAQLARGWAALHRGEARKAGDTLGPLGETDTLAALGLALLETDEAARLSLLDTIRQRDPAGIAGLLAAIETRRMGGNVEPTRDGRGLRDYLNRWPSRIWHTDLTWSPWISMRLEIAPARLQYLTPVEGVVNFRNLAGVPLSVGPGATVSPRMIVGITPSKLGQTMEPLPPMIVDIGRTLTIPEGGSLRVPFRLDYSALGRLLADNPGEPIDLQATAILDPRPTDTGGVRPGPVGAMDTNRAVQSTPQVVSPENIEGWITSLSGGDSVERLRAVARLLNALEAPELDETLRKRIADTLAARFADADAVEQAWTVRFLPPEDQRPEPLRRVVELAQRSREPLVRVTHLAAQVGDADHPALVAALRDEDPIIGEFARALRTGLREAPAGQP